MHLRLNRKSPLPIHIQLKAQLAHLIQAGEWLPGRRLPTVRQLAGSLRINRNTASRVFADLAREGHLSCERGRGTFVSPRRAGGRRERTRELLLLLDEAMGRARRLGVSPAGVAAGLSPPAPASAGGGGVGGRGFSPAGFAAALYARASRKPAADPRADSRARRL